MVNFKEIIIKTQQSLAISSDLSVYALMDYSQLSKSLVPKLEGFQWHSTWAGRLKMHNELCSVVLIKLDKNSLAESYADIVKSQRQYMPYHSLLISKVSIKKLAIHFGYYSLCQLENDGQNMILRFADTRILPVWLKQMTDTQRHDFLAPIHQWFYPDRNRLWQCIEGENTQNTHLFEVDAMPITQAQYAGLLDASILDKLVDELISHTALSADLQKQLYPIISQTAKVELAKHDIASISFLLDEARENCLRIIESKLEEWQTTLPTQLVLER